MITKAQIDPLNQPLFSCLKGRFDQPVLRNLSGVNLPEKLLKTLGHFLLFSACHDALTLSRETTP